MPRYEFIEGASRKFWEISLAGTSFTTRWGRIGTAGQSTTKAFSSEAEGKAEHDKLVAEKLKKGYVAAGGSAPAASSGVRHDIFVENDSGGFSLLSAGVVDRVVAEGRKDDLGFVKAHEAILVQLVGDDSFIVRVVVGGALTPPEAEEWIARIRWPLQVSGGKLLVCGGFDPRSLAEWRETGDESSTREVAVPDGKYLADIYTFLHTMNGRVFLEEEWNEKLGAWFRRDHKKRAFPSWVAGELARSPEDDSGHEKAWKKLAESVKKRMLVIETEPLDWVGFLVHLQPFDAAAALSEPGRDGWFAETTGLRRPERCPLGIAAVGARDDEVRYELRDILPAEPKEEMPVRTVDVMARVTDRALVAMKGGPVEHAVANLVQVYRLAWLATDSADPEIRVEIPAGAEVALDVNGIKGAAIERTARTARIGFEECGAKWAQLSAVKAVADKLKAIPDGSVLELLTAPEPDPEQHRDYGVHRYRGGVRGGAWQIAETYPALESSLLREALAFSAAVDGGESVPLQDAAEGEKAIALSKEDDCLFRDNPIVVRKNSIGLKKKDAGLLHFVAGYVFDVRWAHLWPGWVEPEEDRKASEQAKASLQESIERLGKKMEQAAAPKGAREFVFKGKVGTFDKIDLRAERPRGAETFDSVDAQLARLGFQPLGDLVCSRFQDVLIRGYARESGDTWAAMLNGVLETTFDFVTQWEGAGLTTTLKGHGPGDDPRTGQYYSRQGRLGFGRLGDLHAKHEQRKATLSKKLGTPLPAVPSLVALAEAVDRGVARQLGIDSPRVSK